MFVYISIVFKNFEKIYNIFYKAFLELYNIYLEEILKIVLLIRPTLFSPTYISITYQSNINQMRSNTRYQ